MQDISAFDRFFSELHQKGTAEQKQLELTKAIKKSNCPYLIHRLKDLQKANAR
ncbi:hypothetical protein [Marinoscillum furvescens]|uniref:Uncharacterized protein n=1 Tax=Marinoscillum furvescens DSM 4134 TaxID=1122208 RepID=A0A3D9L6T3_MARFU|nr:hypothetical protein [Marinoscillum furvescens]REE00441.1 hypothetical protein C7460_10562 [Marinoscillum furvescens DSM 4134]